MSNLIKKIQNVAFQNELWKKGSKIVVGVSGGPDSVCLLDVLSKIKDKCDFKLIIAHVNYGLRGKDSDRDALFVENLANRYGLEYIKLKPEISIKTSSENTLRDIRYAFFEKLRKNNDYELIAVAHNIDDQAETFLMRLIRGSGLAGLAAMKYKNVYPVKSACGGPAGREFNRGAIIRPLLGISRAEILEYLKINRLKYRLDKTNNSDLYLRNKIRNKLIPYLEKNFNPDIKKTIFNSISSISADYDFISAEAVEAYRKNKDLRVKKLLDLHPAIQRRVILKVIEGKLTGLKDIEFSHIEEVIKILKSAKSKNQKINFQGLKITRIGDKLTLWKN
jgi:tRNA(Ile)-lysidine synthase